jgi:molybdopterin-synthase adenylyltransferase
MRSAGINIAVIGVGALGTRVCEFLGEVGVDSMLLVDPDRTELSNVCTTPMFLVADVGRFKVDVVADFLALHSPRTRCYPLPLEVASVGLGYFDRVDIVFSCVDSDAARVDIGYIAKSIRVPVCDGGLPARPNGRTRVSFFARETDCACYACLLAPSYRTRLLQKSYGSSGGCSQVAIQTHNSSTPMLDLTRQVARKEVTMGLELLSAPNGRNEFESISFSLSRCDLSDDWEAISHHRSACCPFHEPQSARARVKTGDDTIARLLERTGASSVVLDWPICLEARCRLCSTVCRSRFRMAEFWSQAKCPNCLSMELTPIVVLHEIDSHSHWSQLSLDTFGITDKHLLQIKRR